MWKLIFFQPLVNALIFFYQVLGQNLGLAIIGLTAVIRGALNPLTAPSIKSAQKLKELQPELAKLKEKYGQDRQAFAQAQLKFYQKEGFNPAAGCLPQIVQIVILIALFQAFNQVLQNGGNVVDSLNQLLYQPLKLAADATINSKFFYLDLTRPDLIPVPQVNLGPIKFSSLPGPFLIAAAIIQFFSSRLMLTATKGTQAKAKKTEAKSDDIAAAMQEQMLYLFPIMTLFVGLRFPSGLVLYWLTFSIFMLIQQMRLKNGQKN